MRTLKSLARRYARWRDDTDPYLMAATFALAGEPALAREILRERDSSSLSCGEGGRNDECRREAARPRNVTLELAG